MSDLRILDTRETAKRLIAAKDEILRRWEATLRQRDPAFDQHDPTPLRDQFPRYLDELAHCLASDGKPSPLSAANDHGTQRTRLPNYSLDQVFEEYRVLRAVVFAVLEERGARPDEPTRERLMSCIEDGLLEAGQAFAAVHLARAKLATERRQQLLEIVSHDLRNPLQSILVATTLVTRMVDDEQVIPHLRQITSAARTAARLTSDLVDISQIESGGLSVSSSATPVPTLLEDALDRQRENADVASVRLQVHPAPVGDAVLADHQQVLRVFDNLISNALKATKPGGTITLTATTRGADVEFRVTDTGCGIAPDEVDHIFDRFWQVQRQGRSGAGLGLAITKGLLEAHGGRIWIESTAGRGTDVYFTLPLSSPP